MDASMGDTGKALVRGVLQGLHVSRLLVQLGIPTCGRQAGHTAGTCG